MLMRDERLATLRARFDEATTTLTFERDGKQVAISYGARIREGCILFQNVTLGFGPGAAAALRPQGGKGEGGGRPRDEGGTHRQGAGEGPQARARLLVDGDTLCDGQRVR